MNKSEIHSGSWAKSIFKVGKWYVFTSLLIKGLAVFTMPIFTHYMTPVEIGEYGSLNSIKNFLPIIISFGLDAAFIRFFQLYKNDNNKLKSMFSTTYWFVLIIGFISVSLFIFFYNTKAKQTDPYTMMLLCYPAILLQLGQIGISFFNQSLESRKTTLFQIISTLIGLAISILLVAKFNLNVKGRIIGDSFLALSMMAMITVYFIKHKILNFQFSFVYLKEAFLFSAPLLPTAFAAWINTQSPILMVQKQYPNQDIVGLFSIASSISLLMYYVIDAITQVLSPVIMSGLINDPNRTHKKTREMIHLCMIVVLFIHLFITYFAQEIIIVVTGNNPNYKSAYLLVSGLTLPYLFSVYHRLFNTIIGYHKKNIYITLAVIVGAIVLFILNQYLIPIYGAKGVFIAQASGTLIMTGIEFYYARKLEKMNLGILRLIQPLIVYLITIIIFYYFIETEMTYHIKLTFKILLIVTSGFLFIFVGNYWESLKDFIRRKVKM